MPASGGRFGVNDPPPAATTTTLARNSVPASVVRRKRPSRVPAQRVDPLAEMKLRTERLDLLHQAVGQLLPRDDRQRRNIIDGLFGIKLGALSAGPVENVDDMRLDIEKPQFEHREQTARPGADDDRRPSRLALIVC